MRGKWLKYKREKKEENMKQSKNELVLQIGADIECLKFNKA